MDGCKIHKDVLTKEELEAIVAGIKSIDSVCNAGYDVTEPELMFYGGWEMNLTDPDGNKILFLD